MIWRRQIDWQHQQNVPFKRDTNQRRASGSQKKSQLKSFAFIFLGGKGGDGESVWKELQSATHQSKIPAVWQNNFAMRNFRLLMMRENEITWSAWRAVVSDFDTFPFALAISCNNISTPTDRTASTFCFDLIVNETWPTPWFPCRRTMQEEKSYERFITHFHCQQKRERKNVLNECISVLKLRDPPQNLSRHVKHDRATTFHPLNASLLHFRSIGSTWNTTKKK